jgi:hypothetical protein
VDDLLDETTDVTVALGKVKGTELGGRDTVVGVRAEDSAALTLVADDFASATGTLEGRGGLVEE